MSAAHKDRTPPPRTREQNIKTSISTTKTKALNRMIAEINLVEKYLKESVAA
jgi:hypothetical protein